MGLLSRRPRHDETRPAPGGPDGQVVEHVNYSPPRPYYWGQGFPTPFGLNYMSQWPKQFLPTTSYQLPVGVSVESHMYPTAFGNDGRWQTQLNGGTPRGTVNEPIAQYLQQHGSSTAARPTSAVALAGAFGRT